MCSGEMKLQPMFLENSTAASKTRLLAPENGTSVASPGAACAGPPLLRVARHASRARSTRTPDPRNPAADRSSATRPSSRWCGATASSPIPRASRCENTTAFTARSVNRSNTALTTAPRRRWCCPRRGAAGVASVTADALSGRASASALPPAADTENRRRRAGSEVARMDADGADEDEQQHASIVRIRRRSTPRISPSLRSVRGMIGCFLNYRHVPTAARCGCKAARYRIENGSG
uniref:Uncharacterized protein n=2 Tax=Arundo donax TaxID=35708 RepID=A0A0A9CU73_ARUDO